MPNYVSIDGKWVAAESVQAAPKAPPAAEAVIKEEIAKVEKVVKAEAPASKPKVVKKKK